MAAALGRASLCPLAFWNPVDEFGFDTSLAAVS
jgi:hypothetical protein